MNRLLELSPERVARERTRSTKLMADDRVRGRQTFGLILLAGGFWGLGLVLLGIAGHVENFQTGGILLWLGVSVGNAGPMAIGLWYWHQNNT